MTSIIIRHRERYGPDRPIVRIPGDDGGTTNQFVRTLAEVRAIAEAIEEG